MGHRLIAVIEFTVSDYLKGAGPETVSVVMPEGNMTHVQSDGSYTYTTGLARLEEKAGKAYAEGREYASAHTWL